MKRQLLILAHIFLIALASCIQGSSETQPTPEPAGLTKDSLKDLAQLKKLMAQSIHPILFGCDTLQLVNVGPLNAAQVKDKELALIYRPLKEDSSEFSKVFANKVIYYSSEGKEFPEDRVVRVEIEGRILSNSEIFVVENYNKYPSSGHIEKSFTFANGKWNYFVKDSSWMSPVFEASATGSLQADH